MTALRRPSTAVRLTRMLPLLLSILLLALPLAGCGKKGPVRPKLTTQPKAPTGLTLQQQGNLFVLAWEIPTEHADGSPVEDLAGFRIRRLAYDAAESCPTCRDPQEIVAELDLDYPAPGQRIGKRILWRDTQIAPDSGYRYAVAPIIVGGHEGPAATVHLAAVPPPAAPTGLAAAAGDGQVSLSWSPPALATGESLVGYNLYRRLAGQPFPILPLNSAPFKDTRLTDRGLVNDRAYEYRVSALVRRGELTLESMPTPGALTAPQAGR